MTSKFGAGTRRSVIGGLAIGFLLAACSDDGGGSSTATSAAGGSPETTEATETTRATHTTTGESDPESSAPEGDGSVGGADVPPEVASEIEEILAEEQYAASTWGVMVRDEGTGDVLVDVNGEKMFVTGSILKTLSAAGVLEAWGPDHTFVTPVYGLGAVDGGVLRGNLVLVRATAQQVRRRCA